MCSHDNETTDNSKCIDDTVNDELFSTGLFVIDSVINTLTVVCRLVVMTTHDSELFAIDSVINTFTAVCSLVVMT